ncbi:MAG TPA: GGDEF domain-containing protein [Scandinavium sp.]|jgi:diguanylate cyclase (GGDEF)-like protein|uniref:sensor domain-containing diguanylate cyclase n=1 Tax=Scandinavium sp. TaxID=2830653 RepID=UPI002E301F1B|nr:GGDEF domain-containing protein [Scandinavium sp.]HEX4501858.1 GGDEF domain-containing protein [Scandinavium sp.]
MTGIKLFPFNRLLLFFGIALFSIGLLHLFSSQVIYRIPTMSPVLFPAITLFLMIFHIMIACFMVMKYLCDKHRLYLMAIACAFAGSTVLMLGTLISYSDWLLCASPTHARYNDAILYYFFRNILMSILFTASIFLYRYRHSNIHSRRNHIVILSLCIGFTLFILCLSWLYSSHYNGMTLYLIDNLTQLFSPLWHQYLIGGMIFIWCVTLTFMLVMTRMRNIFWFSGYLFCVFYIFTLILLLPSVSITGYTWYQARLFETVATLFLIFVLLCDVFTLYKESNSRYLRSYQNSIRDTMTGLFNRSFFYDSLKNQMAHVSPDAPLSVIVCDLDHFKRINDRYGHLQGDKVIQFVAEILQDTMSQGSMAARIGGEEFALLLSHTDASTAHSIAEQIRETVSESSHEHLPEQVTISMGVYTATQPQATHEVCVQRADEAMYQAKESGRNRVVLWKE